MPAAPVDCRLVAMRPAETVTVPAELEPPEMAPPEMEQVAADQAAMVPVLPATEVDQAQAEMDKALGLSAWRAVTERLEPEA